MEAKNQAEALIHSTEKQLQDHAANAGVTAVKSDVETAIAATKAAIQSENTEAIKSSTAALAQVAMKIGEAIYSAKGGGVPGGDVPGETPEDADDEIVDADFEEVKDDKKSA